MVNAPVFNCVVKQITKELLRPITANIAMNQSEYLAIPWNLLKALEKSRVQVAIGFGFPFHWLINWRAIFKPITVGSNCVRVNYFRQSFENCSMALWRNCLLIYFFGCFSFPSSYLPARTVIPCRSWAPFCLLCCSTTYNKTNFTISGSLVYKRVVCE